MQLAVADFASLPAAVRDHQIVALCDQAIDRLGEARTLEDVLGIKNVAEAWEVYTRKLDASTDAQIACTQVTLLAKAKIGAELQAAQERGEVAERGANQHPRASGILSTTLPEIGIPSQRAAEYKALADAGEAAIREEVTEAKAEGRRPSQKRIIDRAKAMSKPRSTLKRSIPVVQDRPPEFLQAVAWLRTGAALIQQLGDPATLRQRLDGHRMALPELDARAIAAFLAIYNGVSP